MFLTENKIEEKFKPISFTKMYETMYLQEQTYNNFTVNVSKLEHKLLSENTEITDEVLNEAGVFSALKSWFDSAWEAILRLIESAVDTWRKLSAKLTAYFGAKEIQKFKDAGNATVKISKKTIAILKSTKGMDRLYGGSPMNFARGVSVNEMIDMNAEMMNAFEQILPLDFQMQQDRVDAKLKEVIDNLKEAIKKKKTFMQKIKSLFKSEKEPDYINVPIDAVLDYAKNGFPEQISQLLTLKSKAIQVMTKQKKILESHARNPEAKMVGNDNYVVHSGNNLGEVAKEMKRLIIVFREAMLEDIHDKTAAFKNIVSACSVKAK